MKEVEKRGEESHRIMQVSKLIIKINKLDKQKIKRIKRKNRRREYKSVSEIKQSTKTIFSFSELN